MTDKPETPSNVRSLQKAPEVAAVDADVLAMVKEFDALKIKERMLSGECAGLYVVLMDQDGESIDGELLGDIPMDPLHTLLHHMMNVLVDAKYGDDDD